MAGFVYANTAVVKLLLLLDSAQHQRYFLCDLSSAYL